MSSSIRPIHLIITCVLLLSTSPAVQAQDPLFLYNSCIDKTNFTRNSSYESNLRVLLSDLSSSNSPYATGFQNATYGRSPDAVYGLFLCRSDLSADICRNCVVFAAKDILQRCLVQKQAIVWYDECMLRYSDVNFFGRAQVDPKMWVLNTQNASDNYKVDFGLVALIYTLIEKAQRSEKLYAADKSNATPFQTRYVMVLCTRDLDADACGSCLNNLTQLVDSCCRGRLGWWVFGPSCILRYERYTFFNGTSNPAAFPPTTLPPETTGKAKQPEVRTVVLAVLSSTVAVTFLISCCYYLSSRKERARKGQNQGDQPSMDGGIISGDHEDEQQMHYLSLDSITSATNGFSDDNKLGEGGFGPVYKGKLPNGRDVAIKRLSKKSNQGLTEFKNEVILIIKLQHRNLVRLLGYCVEEDGKILVYECMSNGSLDAFLFDPLKCQELGWKKRMKIIHGTAKGLQYLHEDSRLKIIHRDLKASNILLDDEMNPKISDFGTARIFGYKQKEESTERIIGTFGYMSPEYALNGMISEKSDIYSFGVLLLEILSGKKATKFIHNNQQLSLVVYAWECWCKTNGLNLIDQALGDSYSPSEAIRCVHIALLCVQDLVMDRPSISQISHMLNNDKELPYLKEPTFTVMKTLDSNNQSSSNHVSSVYEATYTTLEVR